MVGSPRTTWSPAASASAAPSGFSVVRTTGTPRCRSVSARSSAVGPQPMITTWSRKGASWSTTSPLRPDLQGRPAARTVHPRRRRGQRRAAQHEQHGRGDHQLRSVLAVAQRGEPGGGAHREQDEELADLRQEQARGRRRPGGTRAAAAAAPAVSALATSTTTAAPSTRTALSRTKPRSRSIPTETKNTALKIICSGSTSARTWVLARLSLMTRPARKAPSETLTPASAVR